MRERLYRSRTDRMLFGVAGGLARYLDLDPSVVRIVIVLLAFAGGAGLIVYIVAAIIVPEEPTGWAPGGAMPADGASTPNAAAGDAGAQSSRDSAPWSYRAGVERRNRGGGGVLIGVVLVLVGGWLLVQRVLPQFDSDLVWPVLLLLLGGAFVLGALRR